MEASRDEREEKANPPRKRMLDTESAPWEEEKKRREQESGGTPAKPARVDTAPMRLRIATSLGAIMSRKSDPQPWLQTRPI